MSWDTYLKAHSGRDVFDHDSDHVIAWSKRSVPLAWLMFFKTDDLGTAPEEPPDLTTERKAACDLYIARLAASRPALETAVGDTDAFDLLGGYVKSCDLPFLSLTTWEVWIGHGGEPDEWRANFLRALATVETGPSSESWEWALDWCGRGKTGHRNAVLCGYSPGRPWLDPN